MNNFLSIFGLIKLSTYKENLREIHEHLKETARLTIEQQALSKTSQEMMKDSAEAMDETGKLIIKLKTRVKEQDKIITELSDKLEKKDITISNLTKDLNFIKACDAQKAEQKEELRLENEKIYLLLKNVRKRMEQQNEVIKGLSIEEINLKSKPKQTTKRKPGRPSKSK